MGWASNPRRGERLAAREAWLRRVLGGVCDPAAGGCGSEFDLVFHHPKGRKWEPRKLSRELRLSYYEADARDGLLTLLCKSCNERDGGLLWQKYLAQKTQKG